MPNPRGRIPIVYMLYGVSLFLLFILVFFPYKRTAESLIVHFEKKTGISLIYKDLSYRFPLGCRLDPIEIQLPYQGVRYSIFKGDTLTLKLSFFPLLGKKMVVRFLGKGYGGETSGEVRLRFPVRPESGRYLLQVKDIRIAEALAPLYLRNFKVSGKLTGQADVQFHGLNDYLSGPGTFVAALSQGRVRNILIKGLNLPDFDFHIMQIDAKLTDGKLRIENLLVESDILAAKIRGEIILNPQDLFESGLHLSARLKPMADDPINLHGVAAYSDRTLDQEGYYPFELKGTFRYPELQ
ncbi:MAG: type II secretion system protein GspN [Nitrospirae bacterium CG08_land_8_20_14_0_20_52_24]|nr:MAG: type II secretion system protein GspN [Nitrospirae bacterium CG08_land_8_20_14_0_20_52_24]PIV84853.1 MAG: type II secretion system protein GspN [Nitrospirae bacterium CG17_big_fil_post_rev_8_21_14_2_50_50_9]PIX85714.1 MAG: type II secretion system protein GspN [Nitrospirae bacterium CG_4_10_14_3_um_filter_53_41]